MLPSYLLFDETPLPVLPSLAKVIGLKEALVLQRLHECLHSQCNEKPVKRSPWIKKTAQQWHQDFPFFGEKTLHRTFKNLEKKGLVMSCVQGVGFKRQKFYTLCYERLKTLLETEGIQISSSREEPVLHDNSNNPCKLSLDDGLVIAGSSPEEERVNQKFKKDFDALPFTMIETWNKVVQKKLGKPPTLPTARRAQKLLQLLKQFLNTDLAQWNAYCHKIAAWDFLMNTQPSGFQVSLDWALEPHNAVKILEEAFYDKPKETSEKFSQKREEEEVKFLQELQAKCDQDSSDPQWFEFCQKLAVTFSILSFKSWFWIVKPSEFSKNRVVLNVCNRFIGDRLEGEWRFTMERILKSLFSQTPKLSFIYEESSKKEGLIS